MCEEVGEGGGGARGAERGVSQSRKSTPGEHKTRV